MILDAGMNQKSTREILLAANACLKRLADVSSGSDEWIKIYWLGARMPRALSIFYARPRYQSFPIAARVSFDNLKPEGSQPRYDARGSALNQVTLM